MPQKRNLDAAEPTRAKTGRVIGTDLLVVMKGLPLAYAKDTQEDKEPVFEAFHTLLQLCLAAMAGPTGPPTARESVRPRPGGQGAELRALLRHVRLHPAQHVVEHGDAFGDIRSLVQHHALGAIAHRRVGKLAA